MKTRFVLCVNIINLHSTVREEEVRWTEFGVFKFVFLQIMIFHYCTFLFISM